MAGYRHCVTESSADRQRQFEEALLTLMEAKPLAQVSIQDICEQVGLSRKSFYRYFSSREACLYALIDHIILDFADIPGREERMREMLERFFTYWQGQKRLLGALYRNGKSDLLFERATLCAIQEYGGNRSAREQSGDFERTLFVINGLFGVLLNWYLGGCQKSPAQLASTLGKVLPQYPHGVF